MLRDFEESDTKGPDVGRYGVRLAGDALGSHIVGCANKGIGVAFGSEFATDAEIAEFDLAIAAEENVRWLYV